MGHEFVDESTRATLEYVNKVVDDARERWRGAMGMSDELLEERMDRLRDVLLTHPVAMEYVARAMPRAAVGETMDSRRSEAEKVEKASGE